MGLLHNGDFGGSTSGRLENRSIEFFCLYFIPEDPQNLDTRFYQKEAQLNEKSNELTYGAFIIGLYLL